MDYQALFEPAEEGGFIVTFPDFEFGITQGDTEAEAREMAEDSLALVIESYIEQGNLSPPRSSAAAGNTAQSACRRSKPPRRNSTVNSWRPGSAKSI